MNIQPSSKKLRADTEPKTYSVKEAFYTLQGEGAQSGRPAVFCRFSKCNLWNGRESGRNAAVCQFCDTDFVGTDGQHGGLYSADELSTLVNKLWPKGKPGTPYVVCTGGEPLLQLDSELIAAFHQQGFEVAVETNGTLPAPDDLDWVCLSPKANSNLAIKQCHELKLVYPQPHAMPDRFAHIEAQHRFLQPMDLSYQMGAGTATLQDTTLKQQEIIQETVAYCLQNPEWKLSLQTHKWLGID
jgi:7-carboxy-7-deazaguanine synthase